MTTRVDDDMEMTTTETTAREDFEALKKSHKHTLDNFRSKTLRGTNGYQETAKYYKKNLEHYEGLAAKMIVSPNEYLSKTLEFLHKAIPLLERAEGEEDGVSKEKRMEDIVNISDEDEEVQKAKEENAWKKMGMYVDGVLDKTIYKDEPCKKKSPKKASIKNTDYHRQAERFETHHEKDNDGWIIGNGGVPRSRAFTRRNYRNTIGPVNGRGASMVEVAIHGSGAKNTIATTTPRTAPRTVYAPQNEFNPERFNYNGEKRPKTRNDAGGSGHKSRERMFEASSDSEEDDPIEDVRRSCDDSRGKRPRGRGRERTEKKEPIVVDLLDDDEDDESNKPIEIDSPIQQRRRTTRQNAGSLHSGVAKFGKYNAKYPNNGSKGAALITTNDLDCLEPGEMLNDQAINFYMKKIAEEEFPSPEDKERCLVMNSYFYSKLTQKSHGVSNVAERKDQAYERVKKWTKSLNIFEKDFIFIPIHAHFHWSLAIISYPGLACSSVEGKIEEGNIPSIIHLDSMGKNSMHTIGSIRKNLTQWLQREYNRVQTEFYAEGIVEDGVTQLNERLLYQFSPSVPEQTNGCDCGVFTLLYAQKFIQNLPKEFTFADFSSISFCNARSFANYNSLLQRPEKVLTPRLPDMDKFIERFWKEENLERYKSSEKEEVKEEEEDLSLHIVEEEKAEEVNDLREEDDDVAHFKSKMQPPAENETNRENKENDLKSIEEISIISETDGKSRGEEKKDKEERYISIEKIIQAFPKTWIQSNSPEMFRMTWFPPMESADQMRVHISLIILEALQEEVKARYEELEVKENALSENEKENKENAVVRNFKNVTQTISVFADTIDEKNATLNKLNGIVGEAKQKMVKSEKRRINELLKKIFDARESEDEKIKKVEKAAAEVYQERKRQNLESSGDEEDEVHIVGVKRRSDKLVQATLQPSRGKTRLFSRGRRIWKDGIQPPQKDKEQPTMPNPPSQPHARMCLIDSDDMARKMRRSNNTNLQEKVVRDARLKHALANPKPPQEDKQTESGFSVRTLLGGLRTKTKRQ